MQLLNILVPSLPGLTVVVAEPAEAGDDDQPVDRAVLVRLQAALEPRGVRRCEQSPCSLHSHLAAGHRPL